MREPGAVQLFCLPHAGGTSALYEAWRAPLAPAVSVVPVELPGRGRRLREPSLTSFAKLLADVRASIFEQVEPPFALLGHSMGALLAFEVAHALGEDLGCEPLALIVSAHRAPQLPPPALPRIGELGEAAFLRRARELSQDLNEALEYEELRELFLPVLRGDLLALESYAPSVRGRLECDILALGGTGDPHVNAAELAAWGEQTEGELRLRMLPGNHFFIHHARARAIEEIALMLAPATPGVAWRSA